MIHTLTTHILRPARVPFTVEDTSPFVLDRQGFPRGAPGQGRQCAIDVLLRPTALPNASSFVNDQSLLIDLSTVSPLATSMINARGRLSSTSTQGMAAAHRETHKIRDQYPPRMLRSHCRVVPFVFEHFGLIGPRGLALLDAIAEHVVGGRFSPRYSQKGLLLLYYQRLLSVTLQRGLARAILSAELQLLSSGDLSLSSLAEDSEVT
jgi:hypothetical protein